MKTGWLVRVNDKRAKNYAEKLMLGSRETVLEKVEDLQARGDAAAEGRFDVKLHTPYSEVNLDKRRTVKCKVSGKVPVKNLLKYFFDVNPLMLRNVLSEGTQHIELEIDSAMHETFMDLVSSSDGLISH